MEPSDEVRELRRLRDAVDGVRRAVSEVSGIGLLLRVALVLAAVQLFLYLPDIADALNRIAACQCSAMTAGTE